MAEVIAEDGGQRKHRQCLRNLLDATKGPVRIASAYVTDTDLLLGIKNRKVQLLTSLFGPDVVSGATNLESLKSLIESGVQCRGLSVGPRLHAKVYLFGNEFAVVTSANLTNKGLDSNIEVGIQLSGSEVRNLIAWFDTCWANADRLDSPTISKWQQETAALRREYSALRKKLNVKLTSLPNATSPSDVSSKGLRDLLDNAKRFFLCNTDRKHDTQTPSGGYMLEEEMRRRHFAAAWEKFHFPAHMQKVERGDAIFMFAKDVGIIGVGRAKAPCQTLKRGDPDRINMWDAPEWRVPLDGWLAWADNDADACPIKGPMGTFLDVTGAKYEKLRGKVRKHFLRDS